MNRKTLGMLALVIGSAMIVGLTGCQTETSQQQAQNHPSPPPPPPPPPPPSASIVAQDIGAFPNASKARSLQRIPGVPISPAPTYWQPNNTSTFPDAKPNPVKVTAEEPVSTFSIDVDTASYGVVRDALNNGHLPPADAVRIEEMVNYFDYAYPLPPDKTVPFRATLKLFASPWNKETKLLHIAIKGFDLPKKERPKANLVFLIDTSGSMGEPNKLPLLIRSFHLLVDQLQADDRVAIVAYAGSAGVILESTPGSDKAKIMAALDQLHAGGSTAGGEGIRMAYQLAEKAFVKGAVNRVLLATDGDFNVGITDPKALEDFVVRERDTGIYLTCLGFGNDNYHDATMQKLAQAGNGNAAFIDTMNEARKVFVDQISGTLFTIANDVKIQIEFNPARVAEYRLIGYETRILNRTDFNNDKVDAGDIGSGTAVTAIYEITPVGSKGVMSDPLRYGAKPKGDPKGEYAFLKIRYKLPGETVSKLIETPVTEKDDVANFATLSDDVRFATAVVGAAQLLRHDPYIKDFDYDRAIEMANAAKGKDEFGYRSEFVQLLRAAKVADKQQPLP